MFNESVSKRAYEKIMSQNGLGDLKSLIQRWEKLSGNITRKPLDVPIILPDLFLVSRSGTGRTHFLDLLSQYLLERPNLMDFYGDVAYFEFMLNYCEPDAYFSEIQRFMAEIRNAAGFRSEYRGIVYIDADEWLDHFEEKHFICFMEYLSDNSDDWLVVLSVSDSQSEKIRRMEAFVSAYIRIERMTIENPGVAELTGYAQKLLEGYGFCVNAKALELLSDSIGELCTNKYFDGYKTVKRLCEDIAYSIYTQEFKKDKNITAADLVKFAKDGEYIQGMMFRISQTKRIGFC